MPVDRKARNDLRDALSCYMRGEVSTFAFDERNSAYFADRRTDDASVLEISHVLWHIHDDLIDHPISVSPECWLTLKQILAFLATDLDVASWQRGRMVPEFWPFRDESAWLEHEYAGTDLPVPAYDVQIHGRQIRPWRDSIPASAGFAFLLVLVGIVFVVALCS